MTVIRLATDADGPAVARLIADVFAEYDGCPFVAEEFPELARPASHYAARDGALFVAETERGGIVGSFAVFRVDATDVFEIGKVYVARPMRGSGLAARLFATAEAEARRRGARSLRLWTDTRFTAGHRFYEKLGFARQPVIRYLADATRAWEFCYRRSLPS
jgi:putative acetyltransferase